jgi:hypothetical protein
VTELLRSASFSLGAGTPPAHAFRRVASPAPFSSFVWLGAEQKPFCTRHPPIHPSTYDDVRTFTDPAERFLLCGRSECAFVRRRVFCNRSRACD